MNIFRVGRMATGIAGAWLFLSAVFIHRTQQGATNAAIVGALAFTVALVSLYRLPLLRFLQIPLSIWLFITAWLPGETPLSIVNDLLVSTWLFGFGSVPTDLDPDELRYA